MKKEHLLNLGGLGYRTLSLVAAVILGQSLLLSAADGSSDKKPAAGQGDAKTTPTAEKPPSTDIDSKSLFDGKSLQGWKKSDFAGSGEVEIQDGQIILGSGNDMTGITWTNDLPQSNYEITWEAKRVDGSDFFSALTFPVKKEPCSFITGGWGGGVVGLSSLDGSDASENETTTFTSFTNGQWYRMKLRVTDAKIEAWIDEKKVVEVKLEGRRLSIRIEVEACRPLGFATWRTTGALRNIRLQTLDSLSLRAK